VSPDFLPLAGGKKETPNRLSLEGRLTLRDLVEQGWKQVQQEVLQQLRRTIEGLLTAERDRRWRGRVLRLVREKYSGGVGERFGPTLAAEHLAEEDGVEVHAETLRRWMLAEGLWSRERKRTSYRKRRARREPCGELVQLDGSFEAWREERGPAGGLMNLVDDASGTTLCRLGEQETLWAAVGVLWRWIQRYGVPRALDTDGKNVEVREPTAKERLTGDAPRTRFGPASGGRGGGYGSSWRVRRRPKDGWSAVTERTRIG